MLRFSMASASGWGKRGRKLRMNRLKFSFSSRWASLAIVSNTIDDLPDPETPVKIVILRLGMRKETFFKLFSRAPRISMYSCGMNSLLNSRHAFSFINCLRTRTSFGLYYERFWDERLSRLEKH